MEIWRLREGKTELMSALRRNPGGPITFPIMVRPMAPQAPFAGQITSADRGLPIPVRNQSHGGRMVRKAVSDWVSVSNLQRADGVCESVRKNRLTDHRVLICIT